MSEHSASSLKSWFLWLEYDLQDKRKCFSSPIVWLTVLRIAAMEANPSWCHGFKTMFALVALCERKQRVNDLELRRFLCCHTEPVKQTVDLRVNLDANRSRDTQVRPPQTKKYKD